MRLLDALKETGMARNDKFYKTFYVKKTDEGYYAWCSMLNDECIGNFFGNNAYESEEWLPYTKSVLVSNNIKVMTVTMQCSCGQTVTINLDWLNKK